MRETSRPCDPAHQTVTSEQTTRQTQQEIGRRQWQLAGRTDKLCVGISMSGPWRGDWEPVRRQARTAWGIHMIGIFNSTVGIYMWVRKWES